MKKMIAFMFCLALLTACFAPVMAESGEEWICPACGAAVSGNFCSNCGEKRPEDGTWICPVCGAECAGNFCPDCGARRPDGEEAPDAPEDTIRLDLDIAFEKNAYFSTYDVKLFVDEEWIATLRHGVDFTGTLYVGPGRHILLFEAESSASSARGSTIINISEPSLYQCEIHAKMDAIQITGERTEALPEDQEAPDEQNVFTIDGGLELKVSVEFKKNGVFSQYDVDMYCDDTFVASLPHGKNFEGTLLVSQGSHMLTFCKSGSRAVRGTCSFKVDQDAFFSCRIEAERNKVDVKNDNLSY